MTLVQIRYFLEVARCKNISEAEKHLFITQPTLGRQLTAIESELNMQLMIRSNKGIQLTPAGIVLQEEFFKEPLRRVIEETHRQGMIYEHHSCG